jgi:transposase
VAGWRIYVEFERWRVNCPHCAGVHVERLHWLATNPRYTRRYTLHFGGLCREMTNKAVAELEHLHDRTAKNLDSLYMQGQVRRGGMPTPWAMEIDELPIRKGHTYRVVLSDLERERPIWVGGEGREEADIDLFFEALCQARSARIKLAVMDMWRPFRNSVTGHALGAHIVFDKFHIMRHLSRDDLPARSHGMALQRPQCATAWP